MIQMELMDLVSHKNGTGNNGTGNKGTNSKVDKTGTFSILGFRVRV